MADNQCQCKLWDFFLIFSDSSVSTFSKATNIIKDFLKQKSVTRFRPYDVKDLLQPLVCSQLQKAPEDQVPLDIMFIKHKSHTSSNMSLCEGPLLGENND